MSYGNHCFICFPFRLNFFLVRPRISRGRLADNPVRTGLHRRVNVCTVGASQGGRVYAKINENYRTRTTCHNANHSFPLPSDLAANSVNFPNVHFLSSLEPLTNKGATVLRLFQLMITILKVPPICISALDEYD